MTISLSMVDSKPWSNDLLWEYLYKQKESNSAIVIDIEPEACCLRTNGVYKVLDRFCESTGYNKTITIKTGNMIESHPIYRIERNPGSWCEIIPLQQWLKDNPINHTNNITHTFGSFTGRNHWARLWLAVVLKTKYHSQSLISYHYFNNSTKNFNYDLYVGLDDLVKNDCDLSNQAAEFLQSCPLLLDTVNTYPIQCPANLNLLRYYENIFVDIVCETNVSGKSFLVTEKTWRSIMTKRPFIIMSNASFLSNLRRLGFQTFDQYWSEDYDKDSGKDRIKKILDIVDKLSLMSLDELNELLLSMDAVLEHNLTVFNSLNFDKINKVFNG